MDSCRILWYLVDMEIESTIDAQNVHVDGLNNRDEMQQTTPHSIQSVAFSPDTPPTPVTERRRPESDRRATASGLTEVADFGTFGKWRMKPHVEAIIIIFGLCVSAYLVFKVVQAA